MIHVSEKKLAANRANGALSHGPKTPEGKARCSQNAVRHGLLADISKLSVESRQGYSDHVQGYYDQFRPKSEFELGLVEEMAIASWHLRRAFAIENQMMENEMNACNHARNELDRITLAFGNLADSRQLNLIQRYQTRLHNRHSRTLRDFILIRKEFPPSESGDPGPYEVPASCVPTPAPEPAPAPAPSSEPPSSPVPIEPKGPSLSTNSSQSTQHDPSSPTAPPPLLLSSSAPLLLMKAPSLLKNPRRVTLAS